MKGRVPSGTRDSPRLGSVVRCIRRLRMFRTVRIYQLLGILTFFGVLSTLWLSARLEHLEKNANPRDQPGSPLLPPLSRRQRPIVPKKKQARKSVPSPPKNIPPSASVLPPSLFPPLPPSVGYLGVMIDAGRHFFPPQWLYEQLKHIHDMGYNYIHFRLTDDQNFALNITIPCEEFGGSTTVASMAFVARREQEKTNSFYPNNTNGGHSERIRSVVYQPEELSKFVRFAKTRYNITVIPEVNIPGHAGAWGTNECLQDIVVPCPNFACSKGYGIPLNVTMPKFAKLVRFVLKNVVEIFDHPPFLHLGGDELDMSIPCLEEAGVEVPSLWMTKIVPRFEEGVLKPIVRGLGYSPDQIIRWETRQKRHRLGDITHYWETQRWEIDHEHKSFVVSTNLYLDVLYDDRIYGYGDFKQAKKLMTEVKDNPPMAIVVGTFELGMEFWEARNVLGRLLAIRMGLDAAFSEKYPPFAPSTDIRSSPEKFKEYKKNYFKQELDNYTNQYMTKCNATFSKHELFPCEETGKTQMHDITFQGKSKRVWKEWISGVCEGLTYLDENIRVKSLEEYPGLQQKANDFYWENVLPSFDSRDHSKSALDRNYTTYRLPSGSRIPNVGIAIDLVQDPLSDDDFLELLQSIESLGMNLIQMNFANDFGQVVEYDSIPNVGYRPMSLERNYSDAQASFAFFDRHRLKKMVELAQNAGIRLIPEINLATNGGGWYKTGLLVNCPRIVCGNGQGVALDVVDKIDAVIPIVLAAILELWNIFSLSSVDQFLHLGSDQREKVVHGCFAEAGHAFSEVHTSLGSFERKLTESLSMVGIDPSKIIRWHNLEKIDYPDRAGNITHYTDIGGIPKNIENRSTLSPFFGTVLLRDEMTLWDIYQQSRRWTSAEPSALKGIVAKTARGQIPRLDHLVAFSMGLGPFVAESEEDFRKEFEVVCRRLECTNTSTRLSWKANGIRPMIEEAALRESCADRTINATQRKSRAFLVSDGRAEEQL